MKSLIIIEVIHRKPITNLAQMVAGRTYNIEGVINAEPLVSPFLTPDQLQREGFTLAELALAHGEVVRT
jgi:hypothetical protein